MARLDLLNRTRPRPPAKRNVHSFVYEFIDPGQSIFDASKTESLMKFAFLESRSGNVALYFCLALVPILSVIGFAQA